MFENLRSCIEFYYLNYSKFKQFGKVLHDGFVYELKFDPKSYDQVLIFSFDNNGKECLLFAATEFGMYVLNDEIDKLEHNFYHNIMATNDYGLGPLTLSKVFHIYMDMHK